MSTYYKKMQIVKHALRYYIARPKANEKDLINERNLLNQIETKIEEYQERHDIPRKES